ncbi:MAG: hypothetical protein J6W64_06825 [Bacilli bacterium]|nr:hypothetical protein [Bacilli bacterium]
MRKAFEGISFVFDIDDTICNNKNRDYANAIPFEEVINKINYLYDNGATIKLYTSRGMVSCNGDIEKIITKNKSILEKWLKKNKVKYNELIFGKPLGDLYVDDKAMNVRDFTKQEFKQLSGHSGYKVIRIGNIVRKEMSEENYIKLNNWYEDSKNIAKSPQKISNLYSTMYIQYIDGVNATECISKQLLDKIIAQILLFKEKKKKSFNKEIVINKLLKHKSKDKEWNSIVDECINLVSELDLKEYASLSHQDLTLSNIIVKDDELYLIDSLYDKDASSYLLDFAKLKMSLDGYEYLFCNGKKISKRYSRILTRRLKKLGIYKEVMILEFMYVVRLYNYHKNKKLVKQFALERMKEI